MSDGEPTPVPSPVPFQRPNVKVLAVDLLPIPSPPISGVTPIKGDFLHADTKRIIARHLSSQRYPTVDVVLSDMAANTTGNRVTDTQGSLELCEAVLVFVSQWMGRGGTLV